MYTTAFVVVLCSHLFAPQPKSEEPMKKDQESIQGTWVLVSGERHGKAFSDDVVKGIRLEFAGDGLATKNKDRVSKAKFKLHADTTPKGIDLDMDGSVGLGIYKLDGDSLTILHGELGDERPREFDTKKLPRSTLLVLKRSQPADPK